MILGIIYVCLPTDFIPDFLGPLGYADDVAVLILVSNWVKDELRNYRTTDAYKNNVAHGFDLGYLFPFDLFSNFFNSPIYKGITANFKNHFPSEGSLIIEENALVQFNAKKNYNAKGYQDETINFFPASIDEVVYVFNHLLYQAKGKCSITEQDILHLIILPSNKTKYLVKRVLDNADQYYDKTLFNNFEKSVNKKLKNIKSLVYEFTYNIIELKVDYFEMEKSSIDCYDGSNINVCNAMYRAKPIYVNWQSMYEVIHLIKQTKSQKYFDVNYLIMLEDPSSVYTINYNSFSKKVRVSTLNSRDIFFERDIEDLIQNKI